MSTVATAPGHLLRISDLDAGQLRHLLDLAARLKAEPDAFAGALGGTTLAMLFDKPSTRTRVSFSAAAHRLGMLPLALRPDELQLGRGEPIPDTARALSGYVSAIAIRTFRQATVEELASASSVPVINALTDDHHPCQALADMLTLEERFGSLDGIRLAYLGDGNNVAASLIEAGALLGVDVVVACPPGYEPAVEGATVTHEPLEAVEGAHAVYTDVWVSMGEDAERRRRLRNLAPYGVTRQLLAKARPDAIFLHCLPAHRGEEVTAQVIDGPQSAVWQQAANRMPTEAAALLAYVGGVWGDTA